VEISGYVKGLDVGDIVLTACRMGG